MTETKRCTKCGETKPLDEFHNDRASADGRTAWCKSCNLATVAARRAKKVPAAPRPTFPELHDCEWLKRAHLREYKSPREIAALLGCQERSVREALQRAGISTMPPAVRKTLLARREATV